MMQLSLTQSAARCSTLTKSRECCIGSKSASTYNGARILLFSASQQSLRRGGTTVIQALKTKGGQGKKTSKKADGDRVAEPVDGLITSPNAYGALAAIYGLLALPAAVIPHQAADFLFGVAAQPHDMLHEPLFRILSAGLLSGSFLSLALRAGSKTGDLNSSVNKRLELGLVVFVTINTLLQTTSAAQPGSVLSFPGFWATAAILGLTVTAAWGGFGQSSEYGLSLKRAGPLPALKKFQDDTAEVAGGLQSGRLSSIAFTLLTAGFFATGVSYLYAPETTLQALFNDVKGDECIYLWRAIGAALISVVSVTSYSLREAADDGSLGDRPFKILGAGLAATSFVHLVVFGSLLGGEHAGPLLPVALGIWGTSFAVSASATYRGSDGY